MTSPVQAAALQSTRLGDGVVTAAALCDLVTHPAEQVRGSKPLWGLAFVVQPFGPLAYYAFGRVNR